MSDAKHTPGPWKVVHNARNCTLNVVSAPDADGESVKIALVNYQDEGNANLIASAPDMLDEIERLRAELAAQADIHTEIQMRLSDERDELRELLRELREDVAEYRNKTAYARIDAALKGDDSE